MHSAWASAKLVDHLEVSQLEVNENSDLQWMQVAVRGQVESVWLKFTYRVVGSRCVDAPLFAAAGDCVAVRGAVAVGPAIPFDRFMPFGSSD